MNVSGLAPAQISAIANKQGRGSVVVHYLPTKAIWCFFRTIHTGMGERSVSLGYTASAKAVIPRVRKYLGGR